MFQSLCGCRETRRILMCNLFSNNGKVAENLHDWTLMATFPSKTNSVDRIWTQIAREDDQNISFYSCKGNAFIFTALYCTLGFGRKPLGEVCGVPRWRHRGQGQQPQTPTLPWCTESALYMLYSHTQAQYCSVFTIFIYIYVFVFSSCDFIVWKVTNTVKLKGVAGMGDNPLCVCDDSSRITRCYFKSRIVIMLLCQKHQLQLS